MAQSFSEMAQWVFAAEPRLGTVRLVVVDGPAGSGKTTFAAGLAVALADVQVVHMDDIYGGWSTALTADLWERLHDQLLAPLANGAAGRYRRYDWDAGAVAETHEVPLRPQLIIEGVGSAARPVDPFATLRVWVEAPEGLRLERGVNRDGEALRGEWVRWLEREGAHFAADGTRDRADLVVDGGTTPDGDPSSYVLLEDRRRGPDGRG